MLRRSLELTDIDSPGGGVRLRGSKSLDGGFDIQVEFADGPLEGETSLTRDGINIYVDPVVTAAYPEALVSLEPQHETIVVGPIEP